DVGDDVPSDPDNRLPTRYELGDLDLDRIHEADVVHDDADLPAIVRNRNLPLLFAERAGEFSQRAGALLEAVGERIGAVFHLFILVVCGASRPAQKASGRRVEAYVRNEASSYP